MAAATSVGEDYVLQQARVRGLIEQYQETQRLAPESNCLFAIAMLQNVLERADKAMAGGNILEILRSYEEMKECQ